MTIAWRSIPRWAVSAAILDLIVAAALTAAGLIATHAAGGVPLGLAGSVVSTSSVALRRRRPAVAVAAAVGGTVVLELAAGDVDLTVQAVAIALCFYLLGVRSAWVRRWHAAAALVGCWLVGAVVVGRGTGSGSPAAVAATWATTAVLPLGLGNAVSRHRQRAIELEQLNAELAAEEELRAMLAAEAERCRIARDLHDVVAHCVSVMVIQAGAAARVLASDRDGALAALAAVKDSGREALRDLRRIVGVIRHEPLTASVPRLSQLPALTDRARQAGVVATLSLPERLQLPLALEATVYRVVQEALTNTIKHAGPAAATVTIRGSHSTVEVSITDDGAGSSQGDAAQEPGSGRGLAGMRERLTAQGGTLVAGKRAEGGFEVRATIPLPASGAERPVAERARSAARHFSAWVDPAIAGVALIAMEAEVFAAKHRAGPVALEAAVVPAMALAALGRRRHPLVFSLVVGGLAAVLAGGLTSPDYATFTGSYALLLPVWTLATCTSRRTATLALVVYLASATATMVAVDQREIGGILGAVAAACVVWTSGRLLRAHRRTTTRLQTQARQLRERREERLRLAAESEAARVARELQAGVAHALATIVIETEAAQRLIANTDPHGIEAIAQIEEAARRALAAMRTTLGVLRRNAPTDDAHSRRVPGRPQPVTQANFAERPPDPAVAAR